MLKAYLTGILFFLCYILSANIPYEYYTIKHITSKNGLPHNLVFDITQSHDGFIWMATNNGLGRYDGYNFKTFLPENIAYKGLSNKSTSLLYNDNKNNLWISINGMGVNVMNLGDYTFKHFKPEYNNRNLITGNNANSYYQSCDSLIWIGTNKGLSSYNYKTNNIRNYTISNENIFVWKITEDKNKNLWIIADKGLLCFNTSLLTVESIFDISGFSIFKDIIITDILVAENGQLIIGTANKGIILYDITSNNIVKHIEDVFSANNLYISENGDLFFISYTQTAFLNVIPQFSLGSLEYKTIAELPDSYIYPPGRYCEDSKNNIWISAGGKLYKIYPDYSLSIVKNKNTSGYNVFDENITTAYIDKMDNLWLRTFRNGVVAINLNQKEFETYTYLDNDIITDKNISMVYVDKHNNIWAGSYSRGITCFNQSTGVFINYKHDPIATEPKYIKYKGPAGICEDNNGNVWVGFYEGNAVCINPVTQTVKTFVNSTITFNEYNRMQSIRRIVADNEKLWFASNSTGITEYNTRTNTYTYHSVLYENNYDQNSHYRFLVITNDSNIWTGTQNGGLSCYNPVNHNFVRYKNIPDDNSSIISNTVYYVYEQNDSILWIGTDKGLNKFNRENKKFTRIYDSESDNKFSIYRIYSDGDNNLWLSGDSGLKKFNLSTYDFITYTVSDGLPTNQFNTTAGFQAHDGKIFLGTSNGLVSFYPENITNDPFGAKPLLTSLKIFNKNVAPYDSVNGFVVLNNDISKTKKITLPHYINDFTLEFSSMHFAAPEKNIYEYRLDGFSDQWIQTTANRRWANFTGLKYGKYIFRLRASNSDGVYCLPEHEVVLHIEILPPYYKTWYFRVLAILFVLVAIFVLHRIRVRAIRNQNIKLEKQVRLRTRELKAQNMLLEENREEITQQKYELEKHKNHLQDLVDEKTADLIKALKKAEESDQLKSAFLANMSHEIRTPMNAILGFAGLINNADVSKDELTEFSKIIHNNAESLLSLLNDIIDISIIESGELVVNRSRVDIDKIIEQVVSVYSKNGICLTNNNVSVSYTTDSEIFYTDPNRLKQILNNLVANAIKFTKVGNINISYTRQGSTLQFCVSDTGIGIENEKLELIFDRFIKIENMNSHVYRGGGLGLSISKKLAEILGGKIWAESEVEKGSVFYFTISE